MQHHRDAPGAGLGLVDRRGDDDGAPAGRRVGRVPATARCGARSAATSQSLPACTASARTADGSDEHATDPSGPTMSSRTLGNGPVPVAVSVQSSDCAKTCRSPGCAATPSTVCRTVASDSATAAAPRRAWIAVASSASSRALPALHTKPYTDAPATAATAATTITMRSSGPTTVPRCPA